MIINEQMSRQRFEHEMRAEVDKRWEVLKTLTEDEMTSLRDSIQVRIARHTAHASHTPTLIMHGSCQLDIMLVSETRPTCVS